MFSIRKIIERFKKPTNESSQSDRIREVVLKLQRKAADYLNHKAAHWSPRKTKIILVVFCLVFGELSLYIAGKAILRLNGPPVIQKEARLSLPAALLKASGAKPADSVIKAHR